MELLVVYYMALNHAETSISFSATVLEQLENQLVWAKPNLRATLLNQRADDLLPLAEDIRTICQHFTGYAPVYPEDDSHP